MLYMNYTCNNFSLFYRRLFIDKSGTDKLVRVWLYLLTTLLRMHVIWKLIVSLLY